MWGHSVERGRALIDTAKACPIAGFVLALAIGLGPVQAHEADTPPAGASISLESHGIARPVSAWVDFCDRVPSECEVRPEEPIAITLNRDVWQLLVRVNENVNAAVKPKSDQRHWGVPDKWDLPDDGFGDCEDYQLLKRKLLAEQGLPRRSMRMTVVIDDENEGHAVLTIRTDRGDFILDNRTNEVLPWDMTEYLFVKREGDQTRAWVALGGAMSPVVTAAR